MVKRQRKNLEDDDPLIDSSAREYIYDEVDEYNELGKENDDDDDLGLSDSENEFDGDTRLISKDKRKEQILGLDLDSSEEDEDDIAGFSDDIENSENEEKDMVENRSLGRRKKDYYGTDITDQRLFNIGRHKTKKKGEEDSLQIEMDGAIAFQKRNLTGKFGFDFDLEPETAGERKGESMEEQLKGKDGEVQSKGKKSKSTQKLKKIMHSKKFSDIDKLAKEVCEELQTKLIPLIEASKNGVLPESFDTDYLLTRYFLCLNFMTTFAADKMLIAGETDMEGHSVEKRLSQYRELFKTMETCKRKYESELDSVLDDLKNGKLKKKRKLLGVVKLKKKDKTVTFEKNKDVMRNGDKEEIYSEDGDVSEVEEEKVKESTGGLESVEGKRLITHEIKKNKGLMPTRKKEQRNPRVKYKRKYQDKLKRRKGQIREVRKELKRYGGEISGINKNVVKSIKLK